MCRSGEASVTFPAHPWARRPTSPYLREYAPRTPCPRAPGRPTAPARLRRREPRVIPAREKAELADAPEPIPTRSAAGTRVSETKKRGLNYPRAGKGPVLMELKTYRYRGHSMSDPAKYRTREEVQDVREHNDAIERAKTDLLERGIPEDQLKDIDKRIRAEIAASADFAENSPEPAPAELYTDVLVESY